MAGTGNAQEHLARTYVAPDGSVRDVRDELGTRGVLFGTVAYAWDTRRNVWNVTRAYRPTRGDRLDYGARAVVRWRYMSRPRIAVVRVSDPWDGTRVERRVESLARKRDATVLARNARIDAEREGMRRMEEGYAPHKCPKEARGARTPKRVSDGGRSFALAPCTRAHAHDLEQHACAAHNDALRAERVRLRAAERERLQERMYARADALGIPRADAILP